MKICIQYGRAVRDKILRYSPYVNPPPPQSIHPIRVFSTYVWSFLQMAFEVFELFLSLTRRTYSKPCRCHVNVIHLAVVQNQQKGSGPKSLTYTSNKWTIGHGVKIDNLAVLRLVVESTRDRQCFWTFPVNRRFCHTRKSPETRLSTCFQLGDLTRRQRLPKLCPVLGAVRSRRHLPSVLVRQKTPYRADVLNETRLFKRLTERLKTTYAGIYRACSKTEFVQIFFFVSSDSFRTGAFVDPPLRGRTDRKTRGPQIPVVKRWTREDGVPLLFLNLHFLSFHIRFVWKPKSLLLFCKPLCNTVW